MLAGKPVRSLALIFGVAACGGFAAKHARYETASMAPPSPGYAYGADLAMEPPSGETYGEIVENQMIAVADRPLSTFSIDVDTASYANVRRFLDQGTAPPADAVRIEELINYFDYAYPPPAANHPFSVISEVGASPWHADRKLVHLGLQGRVIEEQAMPPRNLVFLIDVSGSMSDANKLPLLRSAFALMIEKMTSRDHVSMVVYAGAAGVVLPPTSGAEHDVILEAFERLQAGGSTAGAAGIEQAYALAAEHFDRAAINRVVLATDGDFNVGVSDPDELVKLIERKRDQGIYLTVLGFGMGNLKDATMEQLADHGNGNYAYIDSLAEARKVLVEEAGGTLVTIAKDVKIQVAFDPARVRSYRLVGYENRLLRDEDFVDDRKDAGEIGAGHSVTALYEIEPVAGAAAGELMTVRLRYKQPDGAPDAESIPFDVPVADADRALASTSDDFRFAAAVAGFGMLLRGSPHAGAAGWSDVADLARAALGPDTNGYRREFLRLIDVAARLSGGQAGNQAGIAR